MNKVQSQEPNSNGQINVAIDQLNDFSGTPSESDYLIFGSGTDWEPGALASQAIGENGYSYFGTGTGGSPNIQSGTRFDVGDRFIFRRNSGLSYIDSLVSPNITVASIAGVGGTSADWYMSFDVDAGDWLIYTTTPIRNYSSSQMTIQWTDGTNYFGPKLELDQIVKCPDVHVAYMSLSSTTEIWLRVMASNQSYLHGGSQHQAVAFNFLKVG